MRAFVVMLLIAGLAVAAWFLFDSHDAAPRPTPAPTTTAEATAAAKPVEATVENVTTMPTVAPEAADASQREAVTPLPAGPSGDVLVVLFGSNEPIADADVYYWPPDLDWSKLSAELQELARTDQDSFVKRISPRLRSDAQGRCRVPLGKQGTQVTAIKDDLWAEGYAKADQTGPTTLALRVDRTLHVLVVDGGGQPAQGAAVVASRPRRDKQMGWGIGTTDAAGRVEHRHVQSHAEDEAMAPLDIFARIPGGESEAVRIEATAPPPEVVLHLPPCGSVTVHVRDADGKPIDPGLLGNPSVRLATYADKPAGYDAEIDGLNRNPASAPIDAHGDATFGTVAFGGFVMASLAWSMRSPVVPGPTLTNPRLELVVSEQKDDVVFVGTLLGGDDKPLASSQYTVACHYDRGMSGQNGNTDAAGRFRICIGSYPAGHEAKVSFDTGIMGTNPMAVELPPRAITKGRNDLGEIHLQPHAVLVQGRLVAPPGITPPQPWLNIESKRDGGWQQEFNLRPEWKDGTFTVHSGIVKDTPMRLSFAAPEFVPIEPIEFAAGATGIEIVLHKGGSAAATFLVDANAPIARLRFRFRRMEQPDKLDMQEQMMERVANITGSGDVKDGRLQRDWSGLRAGSYRLQAMCEGVAAPIAMVENIAVADGPCTDPRLNDIDLRGRVRAFEIRATGADGTAIASRDAFVVVRGDDEHWDGFHLGDGVVKLAAPAAVDLIVVANGHRAAFVNSVFDSRTIALEAAPVLQVTFTLPSPLPEGVTLQLDLQAKLDLPRRAQLMLDTGRGMMVENFFTQEIRVDTDGRARVPVQFPGQYSIRATLQSGRRNRTITIAPRTATLPTPGDLVLQVDAKDYASASASTGR